jgi:hypothetical protein
VSVSSRLRDGLFFGGAGVVGVAVSAAIAYFGGSTNVAWFLGSMSVGAITIAPLEAFRVSDWLRRTTSRGRWFVAGLGIVLAGVGTPVYLATDSVAAWWLAPLVSFPVVYLFVAASEDEPHHGGGEIEGPYTPPDARAP